MKPSKILFLLCGILSFAILLSAANPADEWNLLPSPQEIHVGKGRGLKPSDLRYVVAENVEMPVLYGHLDRLAQVATSGLGVTLSLDENGTRNRPKAMCWR